MEKPLGWDTMTPDQHKQARDLSGLVPALIGCEGWRVLVTYPDKTIARYYVGRSTGWRPCHIELKLRTSMGGCQVYWPEGTTCRKLYKK